MQKTAPPMYTGLRPIRSESQPKNGMVKNSRKAAIETPTRARLSGNPSSSTT